eukprot:78233_1
MSSLEVGSGTERLLKKRSNVQVPCFVYVCALLACMSSLNLGYDIGIIATAIIYIEQDLKISNQQIEVMVATANFFAIIGAIISGQLAHQYGRRKIIIAAAIISCAAVLLMAFTSNFFVIVLSRAMNGISIGFSLVVTPLYIAEIAPAHIRGAVVTYGEVVINIGHCAGYTVAYFFWYYDVAVDLSWRIMVGSGAIISGVLFIAMMFMPESPRWLSQHGFHKKAKNVLLTVSDTESEVQRILFDMAETNQILQSKIGWKHIILPCIFKPDIALKKALIIALPIAIFQQLCAIEVWVYYVPKILQENGLSPEFVFLGTIFVGLSKLLVLIVALCLMDRLGRRSLLLISSVLMCIFIGVLGVIVQFEEEITHATILITTALILVVGAFSLGWGPIPWLLNSELFALNVRAKAAGYATLLNRLTAAFTTLTFFTLQSALTQHGVYYLYCGLTIGIVVFVYLKVPETKGKTLEQITKMLIQSKT